MNPQLHEIADRHGCDKGLTGPSRRWTANNYVDVYQAYMHARRHDNIRLLEIGLGVQGQNFNAKIAHGKNVGGGASMKMWAEYLPNARITGFDINDASHLNTDRVQTHIVDQGDATQIRSVLSEHYADEKFDFIIDDGSHRADHQQISLEVLFPHLKRGGYYFIEDLNSMGYGSLGQGPHADPNTINTRDLFREYATSRKVSVPNAFTDASFLDEVSDVLFHSPQPVVRPRDLAIESLRLMLGKGHKGTLRQEFNPTSHKIVVLRRS